MTLNIARFDDTPRVTVGTTPPANPTPTDLWWSTSWADVRVSPSPNDRVQVLTGSATWEHGSIQEPLLWQDGTNWNLVYSQTGYGGGSGGLGWATCPLISDPLVAANWTKYGSNPFLANAATINGAAFGGQHCGVYTEGATTYIYAPDTSGNLQVASCASTPFTPTSLTWNGTAAYTVQATIHAINPRVFKLATNSYVMFFTYGAGSPTMFRAGVATATSPLGPFTNQVAPLTTLDPAVGGGGTDGPVVQLEGSTFVGLYHATSVAASGPTDIYRATIPSASVTADSWSKLDNGLPFVTRRASYEIDQVADVYVATAPGSTVQYAAWDSFDNVAGISSITIAPLSPVLKMWDGVAWRVAVPQSPVLPILGAASNEFYGEGAGKTIVPNPNAGTGNANVGVGTRALGSITSGARNTAVGANAAKVLTTGNDNTAIGEFAELALTTASRNTAVGAVSLQNLTTGNDNTAVGYQALNANVTNKQSTAVGSGALFNNAADNNTAIGYQAGTAITSGANNTAIGQGALAAVSTNSNNTAIGSLSLASLTGGQNNNAIGLNAGGGASMTGSSCNYIGVNAGLGSTSGNANTAIGDSSGRNFTSGNNNTAIGQQAGYTDGTTVTTGSISGATLVGEKAQSQISNVIVLGKAVATRPNLIFGAAPTTDPSGGGVGVFYMANDVTDPASTPTGGGVLYVSAGALKYKGSSGTVTTLGPA